MENTKLGRLYQLRELPRTAARTAAAANAFFMSTFLERTDGTANVSPKRGTFKGGARRRHRVDMRQHALPMYVVGLTVGAAGAVAAFVKLGYGLGSPAAVAALIVIAWYAESQTIRISPTLEVSVSSTLYIFAGVLFGPIAGAAVAAAAVLVVLTERNVDGPLTRWLVWTTTRALLGGTAGVIATGVEGGSRGEPIRLFAAVAVASVADVLLDVALGPIPATLRGRAKWRHQVKTLLPMQISAVPFHVPLIGLLAYVYVNVSPWSVALFVLPVIGAQRLLILYLRQRAASEALTNANRQLSSANLAFATALVATLDARDRYTAGHSAAVAVYARDIARRMGLSAEEAEEAHLCGLVHDIGKIGLPVGLLEKRAPLSEEERLQMEMHSAIGEGILANVPSYADIARIVRHHHERVDGKGYPDGLAGRDIPLISRIISVADAYNAMTSDRPYRDALPSHVARLQLASGVGTQFDTAVVAAFEAILATADESYRTGDRAEFVLEAKIPTALAAPALAVVA